MAIPAAEFKELQNKWADLEIKTTSNDMILMNAALDLAVPNSASTNLCETPITLNNQEVSDFHSATFLVPHLEAQTPSLLLDRFALIDIRRLQDREMRCSSGCVKGFSGCHR